jgi:hypothetical protein
MYKISFYGGPLDGLIDYKSSKPSDVELFCSSFDDIIRPEEFYSTIDKNPKRTVKYYHYKLIEKSKKNLSYNIVGMV